MGHFEAWRKFTAAILRRFFNELAEHFPRVGVRALSFRMQLQLAEPATFVLRLQTLARLTGRPGLPHLHIVRRGMK
jgi:hypothetical protein